MSAGGGRVHPRAALVLTGGGARGAYQVGVLRGLGRAFPEARNPIHTGGSAALFAYQPVFAEGASA